MPEIISKKNTEKVPTVMASKIVFEGAFKKYFISLDVIKLGNMVGFRPIWARP